MLQEEKNRRNTHSEVRKRGKMRKRKAYRHEEEGKMAKREIRVTYIQGRESAEEDVLIISQNTNLDS